jgi:hypothetical protein
MDFLNAGGTWAALNKTLKSKPAEEAVNPSPIKL